MIASVTLNPAVDYTVELRESLADEDIVRTGEFRYDAGGKGINVSKYLLELGVETVATGVAGGFLGEYLLDQLAAAGLAADFADADGNTRLNTTVLDPAAEYKINQDGPTVSATAIDEITDLLAAHAPETVVVAGSLPDGVGPEAIDLIAGAGPWETVVDVHGGALAALEGSYALCKPNDEELAAATGEAVEGIDDAVEAARALRERGFDRVLASLGGDGAVLVSDDGALYAPPLDVEVVDTVGAGDALLAGALAARARGDPDEAALRYGVAVASRVVSISGTRTPSFAGVAADAESVDVASR